MNKTATIFATLTARYGTPQPKDGQEFQAIAQSYEAALGVYSLGDLGAACSQWMIATKYPRWPEPAELLEILRSFGSRPERAALEMSPRVRDAQTDASRWYDGVLSRPLPQGAWPLRWEDAVCHAIGTDKAENRGKSFGWMLTRAWLDGVIPNGFDLKATSFFADAQRRKGLYLAAVRSHGATAVHEKRVVIE